MRQFSYQEVLSAHSSITPGVRKSGFKNTSKAPVRSAREALKRAEKECTVSYTDTMVSYDGETGMWRVDFYKADQLGGG